MRDLALTAPIERLPGWEGNASPLPTEAVSVKVPGAGTRSSYTRTYQVPAAAVGTSTCWLAAAGVVKRYW